jgi:hypothetical protein
VGIGGCLGGCIGRNPCGDFAKIFSFDFRQKSSLRFHFFIPARSDLVPSRSCFFVYRIANSGALNGTCFSCAFIEFYRDWMFVGGGSPMHWAPLP